MKKLLFIILLIIPFIGSGQGLIGYGTSGGYVYKTTDGGVTWNWVSQPGIVNLSFPTDSSTTSSIFSILSPSLNKKVVKVVDILGRDVKPQPNTLIVEIYDDGIVDKTIVVE